MARTDPPQHTGDTPKPSTSPREYGHSSGDRNTRRKESDWPELEGGRQRDATPAAPGQIKGRDAL